MSLTEGLTDRLTDGADYIGPASSRAGPKIMNVGSFNRVILSHSESTAKIVTLKPDFPRTCGFRRVIGKTLYYPFHGLKVPISWLDFLQNAQNLIFGTYL